MKYLLLVGLIAASPDAASPDGPDQVVIMSPAEHQFLVGKFMDMQHQIDDLTKKLQEEKERDACV